METNDNYKIYNSKSIDRSSCVEIQLGKQRKKRFKESSIFFRSNDFLVLEETIWDNHREYTTNSVVKIQSSEWTKIILGIKDLCVLLQNPSYDEEIVRLLGIKKQDQKSYKDNLLTINQNIDRMLKEFIQWIEPKLESNDYITITG